MNPGRFFQIKISAKISGVLPLYKPGGITSSGAVVEIRRSLGAERVGHTGTLDPMAEGVLILVLGGACKAAPYFQQWDKEYVASVRLGLTTDTDDIQGNVLSQNESGPFSTEELVSALESFRGTVEQLPPVFSAKKFQGKPHYKYARQGKPAPREAVRVTVKDIELKDYRHPTVEFRIVSSKGTYVRSIARDFGTLLGCGGTLEALARTKNGPFRAVDCVKLDDAARDPESCMGRVRHITADLLPFKSFELGITSDEILRNGGSIAKRSLEKCGRVVDFRKGESFSIAGKDDRVLGIFEAVADSEDIGTMRDSAPAMRARRLFN